MLKPGIHTDITIEDYHQDKSWLSATGLKRAARSMSEYKYFLDGGYDSETKAEFSFGNAFELALLSPKEFEQKVAIMQTEAWRAFALAEKPDLKNPALSKSYQDLKKDFEAKADAKGMYKIGDVGKHSFETIEKMMESCYRDKWIQELIKNIQYQNTLCWIDPATQIQMKTRPDICKVNKNVLVNLKTTTDASPAKFSRDLADHDYPLQAIVEMEGAIRTGLMPQIDKYFWLLVEKEPPYNAVLYEFDRSDWESVKLAYGFLLNRIKRCTEENFWPGFTDRADNQYGILTARIPAWYQIYSM